ncbi:hypothetical protein C3L33_21390, partial [Rhododendron williamsianum]
MDQLVGNDEIEPSRIELAETGKSLRSSFRCHTSSSRNSSGVDVECASQWAEIDRLPTFERLRSSLIDEHNGSSKVDIQGKRVIDVTKLGAQERHMLVEKLIKHVEDDNLQLLQKMRRRIDKVGVELPTVVVRYNDLRVEATCEVVQDKPLPTLWNSLKRLLLDCTKLIGLKSQEAKINIIDDFNGEVFYNGHKLEEFIPQKTSAYVSQNDLHIPELTVREALDFSARCQGVGTRAEIMAEVIRREKQARVVPDPDIDTYMKVLLVSLIFSFPVRLEQLALRFRITFSNFSDGVSASRGEIIIGPTRALFMDEISNGLDSSTTYQIVACLQQLAHIMDATLLVALLQPAPETFVLFDDIILMAEGKIVYHGPRSHILEFFEDCGFRCPKRKGVADFLQEVISRKDQAQYWHQPEQSCSYISVDMFSKKFKESTYGKKLDEELSQPFIECCQKNASSFSMYSLSKWALFRACMSREWLLMRRNSFVYVFRLIQVMINAFAILWSSLVSSPSIANSTFKLVITASISMTVFLRNGAGIDVIHANRYLGASFYAIVVLFFDGLPELSMTVARLPIFYKQRDLCFYPAWSYAISSAILKVPLSLLAGLIWTSLTYYVIGYSPEPGRFFGQFMLLFSVHFVAISLFCFLASVFRTMDASSASASFAILFDFLFAGFIIRKTSMPTWLKWGFWVSPLSYGEVGLAVNEFLAPRWQTKLAGNTTIGDETLENRGLQFSGYFFWISLGALLGFAILFNIGFALALTFLNSPQSRAIISNEKVTQTERSEDSFNGSKNEAKLKSYKKTTSKPHKDRVVLPFEPLTLSFQDVQYYVETPLKKLQLLCDITGAIRPGVLTALMGITGAGKTTLLDVLAGRKTIGTIQGDIRIGGHPKVQDTFARISGYCEQTDVHSPQITIEESVVYSAWLRLHPEIDSKTKLDFVREVLEVIELDEIMDCLVGIPSVSGLSTEQRKRLTIAVELVSNPSIIFMDEPTTGLDARAAAIVMRAVKNVADTGRTIVCTIHQPSIDIFEAFNEDIPGVPTIKSNYNPATWMFEVTSTSAEAGLGIDFAQVYKNSVLYKNNQALVNSLRIPPDSKELHFATRFPQNGWGQFKSCLWKQHLSYWRSPSYIFNRYMYSLIASLLYGILFWDQGRKMDNQQNLFNVLGAAFSVAFPLGIYNCKSVLPYVSTERSVLYRERFAGMYNSWAYPLAQVTIEVPYILVQAIVFVIITYPMIGYYWSVFKVLWYFYVVLCTLMYFTYLGMLLTAMTPGVAKIELVETGKSWRSSSARPSSSFINDSGLSSVKDDNVGDECVSEWAQIDRLPTFQRLRTSLVDENIGTKKVDIQGKRVVDITQLSALERHMFVEKLIKNVEDDNLQLLQKMRRRIDKVGVELPTVVVRYNSLRVEAECEVVRGKPLPTLWNSVRRLILDCTKLIGLKSQEAKINIIDDFNGTIKPGSVINSEFNHVAGEVFYNGHKLEDFIPQKTSAYVSQNDLHIPEMTVREALDFSACCQGVGNRAEIMAEVIRREKQARVVPDPDIDTYMKVMLVSVVFSFPMFLQLSMGMVAIVLMYDDVYIFFDQAISIEGQKTTLQTDYILKILGLNICAETLVGDAMRRGVSGGQKKRLTTGEIIVGPARALFMDEISNGLDSSTTYQMVACLQQLAHITDVTILVTLLQPAPETFDLFDDIILMAEGKTVYHGPRSHILDFFDDCGFRCPKRKGVADFLQEVISRKDQAQYWHQAVQSYSYISVDMFSKKFKESTYGKKLDEELSLPFMECCHNNACGFGMYSLSKWALFRACMSREWLLMKRNSFIYVFKSVQLVITAAITVTMFLRSGTGIDATYANHYLGASFYAIIVLFFDGFAELTMTVARLPIFYKQRDLCLYPAWSYAISSTILKVPLSLLAALIWTSLTYYGIGYSPEPRRFFGQIMLFFAMHFAAISLFRFLASVFRTMVSSSASGSFAILYVFLFGGFMIPKASMPTWLKWGFWASPLSYGEVGLAVNEFLAPRWQKKQAGNPTIGNETLESHGIPFSGYFLWISLGALLGFAVLFNIGFALALTFLNPPRSRAIISNEKVTQTERSEDSSNGAKKEAKLKSYENTTSKPHKVLMGITGAGKTTLLDVLAGRKTIGIVEGDIRIGGHPKEFVRKVLEIIELDEIMDCLVGIPGVSGLSIEQQKRLTIAVELVANPSIIFMDEPTTGLDARAAAIVMRAVKNVADTGRTIVCTIHQPSIDIFEAFDELILLKTGGHIIYSGPLGLHSSSVVKYFEDIFGVPTIRNNYNPATWMLEITSTSSEAELGIDFAQLYKNSVLYMNNKALVTSLSNLPDSKELHFATRFPQNGWGQFKSCLWKQHLSYWRSPSYILNRYIYSLIASLLVGILFWDQGRKMASYSSDFTVTVLFDLDAVLWVFHSSTVLMDDHKEAEAISELFKAISFKPTYSCSTFVPHSTTQWVTTFPRHDCEAALCLDPSHKDTIELYHRAREPSNVQQRRKELKSGFAVASKSRINAVKEKQEQMETICLFTFELKQSSELHRKAGEDTTTGVRGSNGVCSIQCGRPYPCPGGMSL